MGGLIGSSSPPPPPPAPPPDNSEEKERERRLETIERRRRGRAGTIETGYRGVLQQSGPSSGSTRLKTKLGE